MDDLEDDDSFSAIFEEIGHLLLQLGLHLVLGDHLQMVPRGFAAPLHLRQVLLQLVEIHLEEGDVKSKRRMQRRGAVRQNNVVLMFRRERGTNLGGSRDGSDLRVEVGALREVLHHHGAGVVQQRLLVHRVLHFWNLLQVRQLKALRLDARTDKLFQFPLKI